MAGGLATSWLTRKLEIQIMAWTVTEKFILQIDWSSFSKSKLDKVHIKEMDVSYRLSF